ncbi:MAG: hypothetical protein ACYDHY_06850 [Acidiferrobacterales bacterium]
MKVVIYYKVSNKSGPSSHYHAGGLAANALHSVEVLRKLGIDAHLHPVADYANLSVAVVRDADLTHAIIEAVWLEPDMVKRLATVDRPDVEFVVRAHSKIGFLQVEPEAIPKVRDIIKLSTEFKNIHFSSNNDEFCHALEEVYGPVLYLPNLFDMPPVSLPKPFPVDRPLRIASFGATRLLKLHPNAALAALEVAKLVASGLIGTEAQDGFPLEFYINSDSTPGGESVRRTIRELFKGLSWAKLIEVPWQPADEFRRTIAKMDLTFQLSTTETFCIVAADAVAEGVPVIAGPAITWVPREFQVEIDNTTHAAQLGRIAIEDYSIWRSELHGLEKFVEGAKRKWLSFLLVETWKVFTSLNVYEHVRPLRR